MRRIEIKKVEELNDEVVLIPSEELGVKEWTPTGRMLVDSDGLSFIYILEDDEEQYTYLSLPETTWNEIKELLSHQKQITLEINENKVELTSLREELTYLISNIQGNLNYGKEMVEKVEQHFQP